VKFDIVKFIAGKLHPEAWGDRQPAPSPNIYNTVQVGVVSPERMAELRSMLPATRSLLRKHNGAKDSPKHLLPNRPAKGGT
jgi:hypothetical protein